MLKDLGKSHETPCTGQQASPVFYINRKNIFYQIRRLSIVEPKSVEPEVQVHNICMLPLRVSCPIISAISSSRDSFPLFSSIQLSKHLCFKVRPILENHSLNLSLGHDDNAEHWTALTISPWRYGHRQQNRLWGTNGGGATFNSMSFASPLR